MVLLGLLIWVLFVAALWSPIIATSNTFGTPISEEEIVIGTVLTVAFGVIILGMSIFFAVSADKFKETKEQ